MARITAVPKISNWLVIYKICLTLQRRCKLMFDPKGKVISAALKGTPAIGDETPPYDMMHDEDDDDDLVQLNHLDFFNL